MFRNHLKIALRNLVKNKVYSFINIIGLTVGIACCLIIIFFVAQETNYDNYHVNSDRIYRVAFSSHKPEGISNDAGTPLPVAPAIANEFPEVEKVARIYFADRELIRVNSKEFFETEMAFADSTFFKIFTHNFLQGDPATSLLSPKSIVLTKSMAEKYFGMDNPMGRTLEYDNYTEFTVTGVVEDVPINSHFTFDCIVSYSTLRDHEIFSWGLDQWGMITSSYTYVLLKNNVSPQAFEEKLNKIIGTRATEMAENKISFFLQPLTDIYLNSHIDNEIRTNNSANTLIILSTIGLFILLIASINYMNLATARSTKRAKEVGVRKVMGAFRFQLIKQFLAESFMITFLAFIFAVGLVEISIPYFSELLQKPIEYSYTMNWQIGFGVIGFVFLIGVVSGSYPAFYLSRYNPAKVLKSGNADSKHGGGIPSLRKILVVSQFSLCVLLLFGMIVITEQLEFLRNADMGFKTDHNIVVNVFDDEILSDYESVKNRLAQISNVNAVSAAFKPPVGGNGIGTSLYPNGRNGGGHFGISIYTIDYDFLDHFGLELLAGRGFSENYPADELNSFVVNEEVVKKLGFVSPQDAIGQKYLIGVNEIEGTIVGVVKNFNNRSLHSKIRPTVMLYWPGLFYSFTLNINSHDVPSTLASIEKVWREFIPNFPFEYQFLDEYIDKLYKDEEQVAQIISFFSMIAIIIGCLGLFGLSAFSVEKKTKEIGIRKVLGASVSSVVVMLTKEFAKLVLISNIIAWPVAYYLMNKWLEDFAYKIDVGIWVFVISGSLALIVALLTISYQAIKAAVANPVDSLKYE